MIVSSTTSLSVKWARVRANCSSLTPWMSRVSDSAYAIACCWRADSAASRPAMKKSRQADSSGECEMTRTMCVAT